MCEEVKLCKHGNSPVMQPQDSLGLFKIFCQGCGCELSYLSFPGFQIADWNSAVEDRLLLVRVNEGVFRE